MLPSWTSSSYYKNSQTSHPLGDYPTLDTTFLLSSKSLTINFISNLPTSNLPLIHNVNQLSNHLLVFFTRNSLTTNRPNTITILQSFRNFSLKYMWSFRDLGAKGFYLENFRIRVIYSKAYENLSLIAIQ